MIFEVPPTYGKYEIRDQCLKCLGSKKSPPVGGFPGGNYCRACNGKGYTTIIFNVHAFTGGRLCSICGWGEEERMHELQQNKLI